MQLCFVLYFIEGDFGLVIRPTLLLTKIVAARANCHDFAACLTFYLSSQTVR